MGFTHSEDMQQCADMKDGWAAWDGVTQLGCGGPSALPWALTWGPSPPSPGDHCTSALPADFPHILRPLTHSYAFSWLLEGIWLTAITGATPPTDWLTPHLVQVAMDTAASPPSPPPSAGGSIVGDVFHGKMLSEVCTATHASFSLHASLRRSAYAVCRSHAFSTHASFSLHASRDVPHMLCAGHML